MLLRLARFFVTSPYVRGVWLGIVCALMAWIASRSALLRGLEDWIQDGWFVHRNTRPSSAKVVLIGIDDSSLNKIGKPIIYLSPELAAVVRHAKSSGAAAIGIDLILSEQLGIPRELDENGIGDAYALGKEVLAAGNVVLAEWWDGERQTRPHRIWSLKSTVDPDQCSISRDFGFVNLTEDRDLFVRRQQLLFEKMEQTIAQAHPHFALSLYARAHNASIGWDPDRREILVGDERIPLDAEDKLPINFAGPPETTRTISLSQALDAAKSGEPNPELHGAIVIIGMLAHSQQDYHSTSFANSYARYFSDGRAELMAGCEIHANIIATMADRAYIRTPSWFGQIPFLVAMGAVLGRVFRVLNLEWGFLFAVVHHFAVKAFALYAFMSLQWRVEIVAMLLLGFFAYSATFALRWRQMRQMMGVVKSQAVCRALEADPRRLDPGGEKVAVTILFADIRGFTEFSEKHEAAEVVEMLNVYFSAIVPIVEAERGTIDKFIGDGMMVVFNAPVVCPDHAERAVRAAVGLAQCVHRNVAGWKRLDRAGVWSKQGGLRVGVGIHTGTAVLGAIGSRRRLDYTAIGDTVNTAARIEALNKTLDTEILISAATRDAIPARRWDALGISNQANVAAAKGKGEPLTLYSVAVKE